MEFSTIYDVCVGSGRPFKLTREMLDAIKERMKQDDETTAATQLVKMLGERGFKISTRTVERARKTLGWTLTLPSYVPDKNLLHDPLRNCNRAQL